MVQLYNKEESQLMEIEYVFGAHKVTSLATLPFVKSVSLVVKNVKT